MHNVLEIPGFSRFEKIEVEPSTKPPMLEHSVRSMFSTLTLFIRQDTLNAGQLGTSSPFMAAQTCSLNSAQWLPKKQDTLTAASLSSMVSIITMAGRVNA